MELSTLLHKVNKGLATLLNSKFMISCYDHALYNMQVRVNISVISQTTF